VTRREIPKRTPPPLTRAEIEAIADERFAALIAAIEAEIDALQADVADHETRITDLEGP
jgi:hypothetical protein